MKLQSQVSRKVGDKKYIKSWIVIPDKLLKKLNWKVGQDLEGEVSDKMLIVKKRLENKDGK